MIQKLIRQKGRSEMKHGVKPTRTQKERIEKLRLNPENWFVVKDYPTCFEIVHRVSGERRKLGA